MHTHVNFARVNKIVAMYERPRVNVKVERVSTFTFMRDLPNDALESLSFTCIRQTSDSSREFLKKKNEQIKTAQNNPYG